MSSYSNILLHITFSTKGRTNSLFKNMRPELYKYLSGIINSEGAKQLACNGVEDHIHLLISIEAKHSISDLIKKIKANSSRWIKQKFVGLDNFLWQQGFGCFSVSQSNRNMVIEYISKQEEHHKRISFNDEFALLLKKHSINF